ncbi:hypothetical protein FOA52_011428 [Chlamydomonas sp. UWO 241]|nr:hypothetical protein FOA52_011428 [Chlamydomonas sp. UWO 241]
MEGFSKLPTGKDDFVCSETFEAGVSSCTLQTLHASKYASRICNFLYLPAGFLVDDALVLTVDIIVQYEARFALDSALTLGGAFTLLPVAHKYGFTKLVTRLVDYVKDQPLLCDPQHPSKYIMSWVMLAERLQLDDMLQQRVKELGEMPSDKLSRALLVGANSGQLPATLRNAMEDLRSDTRGHLLAIATSRMCIAETAGEKVKVNLMKIRDILKSNGWVHHIPSYYFDV